ncbi:MAG: FAD-dependent oxidoreductase, partial [Verrucomicrobia bacterium]|nr:FAD-dependent oxidoreductase [Verrucomicrobiota bacterium]
IDQGAMGGACSHGNCGYICPSHVLPLTEPAALRVAFKSLFQPDAPFRVKPTLDRKVLRWFWEFARRCRHRPMIEAGHHLKAILDASMLEYRRLIKEDSFQCEWKESGLLYVLQTGKGMHEFAKTDQLLSREFNVKARRIEGDELVSLDPALKPGLAGAFLYEGDTMLRPDKLCTDWKQNLEASGVKFIDNCKALSIERESNNIKSVITTQGPIVCDQFVFAAGAWSSEWGAELGISIPIQPGKGYSVTMNRPGQCPKYPMLFPEHRVGVTPFDQAYRLGSMMEFVGFDESIPEKRIEQLKRSAEPYLNEPWTQEILETWYGWRPMTWDSLPVIGKASGFENAFLATGHNMLGLSLAPASGKLLAELVAGKKPHLDPTAFSPERF